MRGIALTAALGLLAGGLVAGPPGSPAAAEQHAAPTGMQADFNGDGADDLAIGIPFQSLGAARYAGVVTVLYGSTGKLSGSRSQLVTQVGSPPEFDDYFGAAVAAGDSNRDGFADLAVGAPNEDAFSTQDAGAVSVLYGSSSGLTGSGGQIFTQTQAGGAPGAPAEDSYATRDTGAVSILYGSAARLSTAGGQIFTQVGSRPEAGDYFGAPLAVGDFSQDGYADLAAAAIFEDSFGILDAGAVSVLYGTGAKLAGGGQILTEDTPGVPGTSAPFEYFGEALVA